MKRLLSGLFAAILILAVTHTTQAATKRTEAAEVLLNNVMQALLIKDFEASAKAVRPYLHRSVLTVDGDDITRDWREFSFKKAHENARHYQYPVEITRIRKTKITAIGFKETGEAGKVYDYFVKKKDGEDGLPAPIQIFFPKSGTEPKVIYLGSL